MYVIKRKPIRLTLKNNFFKLERIRWGWGSVTNSVPVKLVNYIFCTYIAFKNPGKIFYGMCEPSSILKVPKVIYLNIYIS